MGPTVLSGPKGSFYPAYVKQPLDAGRRELREENGRRRYASYTPTDRDPDGTRISLTEVTTPEIAGWKLYPARGSFHAPTPPDRIDKPGKVCTLLKPLDKDTEFIGRVHFHNLKPFEVGALLWALTWGGDPQLRHKLGMGRPLGLGEVSIEVVDFKAIRNDLGPESPSQEQLCAGFVREMSQHYKKGADGGTNWQSSDQIAVLLAAANPDLGKEHFASIQRSLKALAPERIQRALNDVTSRVNRRRGATDAEKESARLLEVIARGSEDLESLEMRIAQVPQGTGAEVWRELAKRKKELLDRQLDATRRELSRSYIPVYMPSPQLFARAKQSGLVLPPYAAGAAPDGPPPRSGGDRGGGRRASAAGTRGGARIGEEAASATRHRRSARPTTRRAIWWRSRRPARSHGSGAAGAIG